MPGVANLCRSWTIVARECQALPGSANLCRTWTIVARECQALPGSAQITQSSVNKRLFALRVE
jgi:hypothetical protein